MTQGRQKTTTLYHSGLCQMGPVIAHVKVGTRESNFPNRPKYAILVIDGVEYSYQCDSQSAEEFFRSTQGRTMEIRGGGRDADSFIEYLGDVNGANTPPAPAPVQRTAPPPPAPVQRTAPPPPAPVQRTAPPPPAPVQRTAPPPPPPAPAPATQVRKSPPPESKEEALKKMKVEAMKLSNIYQVAWSAAQHARKMIKEQRDESVNEDQLQAAVASIFIQLTRDGWQSRIPARIIPIGEPPQDSPDEAATNGASRAEDEVGENGQEPPDDVQV